MIVDTSAIIAILRDETDAGVYGGALARAVEPKMSAGTYLETAIVVDLNGDPVLSGRLDDLLTAVAMDVQPVTKDQAEIARRAYRDFGKGSGHRARLNFGDCFGYALARVSGEPLLYKGDDFSFTDIEAALTSDESP